MWLILTAFLIPSNKALINPSELNRELEELLETCKSFGDWPRCASDAFKQFQVPQGLGS